jgi:hypothetical protein
MIATGLSISASESATRTSTYPCGVGTAPAASRSRPSRFVLGVAEEGLGYDHLPLGVPIDRRQASHLLSEPLRVVATRLAADPGPNDEPVGIGHGIYKGIPTL